MSGPYPQFRKGVYGAIGEPSTEYFPSARAEAVGWFDESMQEFWLFGGFGESSGESSGE